MIKNTLWAFGDSMTFGHGCNESCHSSTRDEYLSYRKDGDDIWVNHLGKMLNYEIMNMGKNGASNDYIFDSIIDNFEKIKENDVVIINMTLHGRIEVPFGDEMLNVLCSYENPLKIVREYTGREDEEKIEAIINFQYHFSNHQFYKERHRKRFQFIKERLKDDRKIKFIYLWSLEDDDGIYRSFQTIKEDTKGMVNDTHFSFNGHLNFAHYLNSLMDSKKLL